MGLELRGGTLGGMKIAAVDRASRSPARRSHLPADQRRDARAVDPAAEPALDVESLHPLAVDTLPELREPADPAAAPVRAAAPVVFNGRIDPPGDEDRFVLAVTAGQRLHVAVEASELGSALDGVLQVLGAKGAVIANADDTPIPGTAKPGMAGTELVEPRPVARLHRPRRDRPRSRWSCATSKGEAGSASPTGSSSRPIVPDLRARA